MTISYRKDKKSGITYAYECTSVWVPELKQARNHRKYLGRVDEQGNIIPSSGKRGRPPKEAPSAPAPAEIQQETDFVNEIQLDLVHKIRFLLNFCRGWSRWGFLWRPAALSRRGNDVSLLIHPAQILPVVAGLL